MLGSTIKDSITNIVAFIMVIGGAVNAYLQSVTDDINWFQLVFAVLGAVVAYFTGKANDGTPKKAL